jgi:hypothetical protein
MTSWNKTNEMDILALSGAPVVEEVYHLTMEYLELPYSESWKQVSTLSVMIFYRWKAQRVSTMSK